MLVFHRALGLLFERVFEDRNVHVAQALDFLHGHPLGNERLLHRRDLDRIDLAGKCIELRLHRVDRVAVVELADDAFESLLPTGTILWRVGTSGRRAARPRHAGRFFSSDLVPGDLGAHVVEEPFDGHVRH